MESQKRNNEIKVTIPEGISFSLHLAGPVVRGSAAVVDIMVVAAVNIFIVSMLSLLSLISEDLTGFLIIITQFAVSVGYGIITEWFMNGQTFGKKTFQIRVMDIEGMPLQFYQVALRNLLRAVDLLPLFYLSGAVVCFFSKNFQRFGDHVANTIVVLKQDGKPEMIPVFTSGKYNTLLQTPHIAARIRQNISPEQRALAVDALSRANELDIQARIEVFRKISMVLKKKCEIPIEFTDGIPDEKLVADIVEVLYQNRVQGVGQ